MTVFTKVFGGTTIYPTDVSYQAYTITSANSPFVLQWPLEASTLNIAARIMDITANSAGLMIEMPDATLASTGETILFNNVGSNAFTVANASGSTIVSVAAGTAWQIYLDDNTTANGGWRAFQYGASVSQANAATLAGNGLMAIGATLNASMYVSTVNSNYTFGSSDRGSVYVWNGANGTFTLPNAGSVGNDWFVVVRNQGSGNLSIPATGLNTINGSASINMSPADSTIIVTDGASFYTIGLGKSTTFQFDYTSIAVGGSGNYTLSGTELNRISYKFTGVLTGNRTIITPTTIQQYWVDNSTTGAYSFTVKTASGTGYVVPQNTRAILYCDGTNIVLADSAAINLPVAVANGGTGATSSGGALINLGGTSVGIGVFTASAPSVARADLGSGTVGDAVFISNTQADALTAIGGVSQSDFVNAVNILSAAILQVESDALAYSVALG